MTVKDVEYKLSLLRVNPSQYSLTGELNHDTIVRSHTLSFWDIFYFDERGGRDNEHHFNSESEACDYIYSLFEESIRIQKKFTFIYFYRSDINL